MTRVASPPQRDDSLSAAAVTLLVAGLERSLRVQLPQCSTRSVRLIRSGEAFLPLARASPSQVEAAERAATAVEATVSGALRVAAPLVLGRPHAGRPCTEFLAAHPEVAIGLIEVLADFAPPPVPIQAVLPTTRFISSPPQLPPPAAKFRIVTDGREKTADSDRGDSCTTTATMLTQ